MPGSVTSVFSEVKDFAAALSAEGRLGLLVTGSGQFRGRLTQVSLHRRRLSAVEEHLPRIALVAVPAEMILVALQRGRGPAQIWGGIPLDVGEIMILAAGQRLHMRTEGPERWGLIWLPAAELVRYGSALTGAAFAVPSAVRCWRPRRVMMGHLRHLHSAAIGLVESRSRAVIDSAAAHGLEQQLIHALVECLSQGSEIKTTPTTRQHQEVAVRLEGLLQTQPARAFRIADICSTLVISPRTLRLACEDQLGMGPTEYVRRRMQQVPRP